MRINKRTINLSPGGVFEFPGIGFFRPTSDITPVEAAEVSSIFAAVGVAAAAGAHSMIDVLWVRVDSDPSLRRHFTYAEPSHDNQ